MGELIKVLRACIDIERCLDRMITIQNKQTFNNCSPASAGFVLSIILRHNYGLCRLPHSH